MAPEKSSSNGTLVMKFGGTSVGSAEAMKKAAQIVLDAHSDWPRLVVVTSALSGVTNLLLESAANALQGNLEDLQTAENMLREKHFKIADALIPDAAQCAQAKEEVGQLITTFVDLCQAISILGEASPRALDAVSSLGERMSVRLLAPAINAAGVPARYVDATELIVTNDHFQNAHPDFE